MSNPLAIAAVTATLRNLLTAGVTADPLLADTTVTMQPPDKARPNGTNANQINLFLYQTLPNAAWRNMNTPRQVNQGESGLPPLALSLFYMVTAYGRDGDAQLPFSHHLLGRAMSVINDHAVLGADEIRNALPQNDLYLQLERVRFTLQPLSVEEIFRLWSGFQTQYRLSVAYEVSVILIDSNREVRSPLPVLTRGPQDSGIVAQGKLVPPFATIDEVLVDGVLPSGQNSAEIGATLTINGHHLDGDLVRVLFENPVLPAPVPLLPAAGGTAEQINVVVDNVPAKWVAGIYSVTVEVTEKRATPDERVRSSNAAAFALAPKVTTPFPIHPLPPVPPPGGDATITLDVSPDVRPDQRAILLLNDRQIAAEVHPVQSSRLTFVVTAPQNGSYLIRVRVDGVDSVVVDRGAKPPVFKPQQVVIP
jgi:hypothetical protein